MKHTKLKKREHLGLGILAAITTVVLFGSMYPNWDFPEAAYFFAVALLLWTYSRPSVRLFSWVILLTNIVSWFVVLFWLRHVTWFGLVALSVTLGVLTSIWWGFVYWLKPLLRAPSALKRLLMAVFLASLWVVLEWVRSFLFTGFPWLPLAASQWQRPAILQLSCLTGAYGVSFFLVFFNVALAHTCYVFWHCREKRRASFVRLGLESFIALVTLFFLIGFFTKELKWVREESLMFKVGIVQPDIPATLKWTLEDVDKHLEVMNTMTLDLCKTHAPDLVVWPEAATPYPVMGDFRMQIWVEELAWEVNTPILMGNLAIRLQGWYNGIFFVDPILGLKPYFYAKIKRVPFGEYIPLRDWLPASVTTVVPLDIDLLPAMGIETFPIEAKGNLWYVGGFVCFEDIFAHIGRVHALQRADFLFVVTNDGWFGHEEGAYQHAAHSVLRAVETRRPVIRSGNNGWSGWIDALGRIRHVVTDDEGSIYVQKYDAFEVYTMPHWAGSETFYVRHGDWFVGVCLGVVLVGWGYFSLLRGRKAV